MKYADLHIHTTASDGILPPEEIVRWAKRISLATIAITDHDTINGLDTAIKEGSKVGLHIIPGIELSSHIGNYEVHILGYYINYMRSSLQAKLNILQEERNLRAKKMVSNLKSIYNIDIDMKHIERIAGNAAISRPHIGRVLIEMEIVQNLAEAFDIYIGNTCPAYVPRKSLSPQECIELIKEYGGIPVLAHPGLIANMDIVEQIVKMGIEGMEVYYPKHTAKQKKKFIDICQQNRLLITGGSDFHDEFINNIPSMGNIHLPYKYVELLKLKKLQINNRL